MTHYPISEDMRNKLANSFSYHAPFGDQAMRYEEIRDEARVFAEFCVQRTPGSAEQTLAIRALEEAVMRFNQSIALNEKPV